MTPKRACDVCYKRKIQCTVTNPDDSCEWCSHHDLPCTFTRKKQKTSIDSRALQGDVQELFRRVEHLENSLVQNAAQPQAASSSATPLKIPEVSIPLDEPHIERDITLRPHGVPSLLNDSRSDADFRGPNDIMQYLGQNWFQRGSNIFDEAGQRWILSKTGEEAAFNKFNLFGSASGFSVEAFSGQRSDHDPFKLPSKDVAERIINDLFRSSFYLMYQVPNRELFKETMALAYNPSPNPRDCYDQIPAKTCVLAALTVACQLKGIENVVDSLQADIWVNRVQALMSRLSVPARRDSLQTIILLEIHRFFAGQWERAASLHSIACRIVCAFDGHFSNNIDALRYSRRFFWLCYMFDKDISLRSGQPPLLAEESCDLTPPVDACRYNMSFEYLVPIDEDSFYGCHAMDRYFLPLLGNLELSQLKETTCRLLFAPKAFKSSDLEILAAIRILDKDLEDWRLSIPQGLQPMLSLPHGFRQPFRINDVRWLHAIHLQLEYLYLAIVIHTSVRQCGAAYAEAAELPQDLHNVFHSSGDISLEAGRSTLLLLKSLPNTLERLKIWHIIFYPPVAAMALFINILLHPLNPHAQQDLELLRSTIGLFQDVSAQSLSTKDIEYIKEMNNFIAELVRLGDAAVLKAREEEQDL